MSIKLQMPQKQISATFYTLLILLHIHKKYKAYVYHGLMLTSMVSSRYLSLMKITLLDSVLKTQKWMLQQN